MAEGFLAWDQALGAMAVTAGVEEALEVVTDVAVETEEKQSASA